MGQLTYLALLVGVLVVTAPLEVLLHVRVYARWRRLALAVLPGLVLFLTWILYAIAQGHWSYDPAQTSGVVFPGDLPLEEVLFCTVIPIASVLSLEAVRTVTGWDAGYVPDEDAGARR